jgi:hypothetical protein
MKALIAVAACAAVSAVVQAGAVTYTGTSVDFNGAGFGNVLNVLSVMNRGSEFGSVLWNGSADVLGGDAANTSQTRTVAAMQAKGIGGTSFALYFNGNEPGNSPSVTLNDFALHFLAADGTSLFDALYSAPVGGLLISDFGGTGQAGWLFQVTLSAAEAALFFGDATNRLGMSIGANSPITGTAGGAENFFLGALDGPGPGGDPVPEPASVALWSFGAFGAFIVRQRARRRPNG